MLIFIYAYFLVISSAPEVLKTKQKTFLSDMWRYNNCSKFICSFGIAASEILQNCKQKAFANYENKNANEILDILNSNERPYIPNDLPEPIIESIKKCWEFEPNKRITFDEMKKTFEDIISKTNETGMAKNVLVEYQNHLTTLGTHT